MANKKGSSVQFQNLAKLMGQDQFKEWQNFIQTTIQSSVQSALSAGLQPMQTTISAEEIKGLSF